MSYLKPVTPEQATGEVADIYQQIASAFGGVPAIIQSWSIEPFYLKQQWDFITHTMQNPNLSPALQACIRMTVGQQSDCAYCIDMNAGMLINMFGWTIEQVQATRDNPANANLDEKEITLLLFILKVVQDSRSTTQADFDALMALGYTQADIFEGIVMGTRMLAGDMVANALNVERDF